MLKHRADLRTLAYMGVTTVLLVLNWLSPTVNGWLLAGSLVMAVSVSVIAHNHNHVRMWRSKTLNVLTDYWLTIFYGFPVFAWIPTHNKNHHKLNNRPGDYTATWRWTERNHLGMLLAYPAMSGYHQQKPIRAYLGASWHQNRARFWLCLSQVLVLAAFVVGALVLDWKKALLYVVLPQQVATFSVLVFNYLQHVHADEESAWNHSRNFTGPVLNAFLFNNGFHTVHHWRAAVHWSETPALHREVGHRVDPALNESSMAWYLLRTYLLAPVIPKLRRRSMRLDRIAAEKRAGDVARALSEEPAAV